MAQEQNFQESKIPFAISKAAEAVYGEPLTDVGQYEGGAGLQFSYQPASLEVITDAGLIGPDNEWETESTPEWLGHTTASVNNRLNTQLAFKLLARHCGKVTTTPVAGQAGAYDHVIEFDNSDTDIQLDGTSLLVASGSDEDVAAGMVGSTYTIQQTDGAAPTFAQELVGIGKTLPLTNILSGAVPITRDAIPAAPQQNYMIGSATKVVMNDGALLDLTSVRRYQAFNLTLGNNPMLNDRRAGADFRIPGDPTSGAVMSNIFRGDRRTIGLSLGVFVGPNKREQTAQLSGKEISAFSWLSRGKKIGATAAFHEVEAIMARSVITAKQTGSAKGLLIYTLGFNPLKNAGDVGPLKIRVRNGLATVAS